MPRSSYLRASPLLTVHSGEMLPFTLLQPGPSWRLAIFTISVISATVIQQSSIALPTPRHDNFRAYHILKGQQKTRRSGRRKTNTGQLPTRPRRTELDADAAVTLIFEMLKEKKAAVLPSGLKLPGAGLHLDRTRQHCDLHNQGWNKVFDYAWHPAFGVLACARRQGSGVQATQWDSKGDSRGVRGSSRSQRWMSKMVQSDSF